MYYGNGLAPVTLTGENPLSEVVVNGSLCYTHLFEFGCDGLFCFFNGKTRELFGIDEFAAFSEIILLFKSTFGNIASFDNLDHFDVVSNRIFKVTLIVSGNRHNSAGTVIGKNEVTDEHAHFFAVYGVDT